MNDDFIKGLTFGVGIVCAVDIVIITLFSFGIIP